jgi:hypothetical protein
LFPVALTRRAIDPSLQAFDFDLEEGLDDLEIEQQEQQEQYEPEKRQLNYDKERPIDLDLD